MKKILFAMMLAFSAPALWAQTPNAITMGSVTGKIMVFRGNTPVGTYTSQNLPYNMSWSGLTVKVVEGAMDFSIGSTKVTATAGSLFMFDTNGTRNFLVNTGTVPLNLYNQSGASMILARGNSAAFDGNTVTNSSGATFMRSTSGNSSAIPATGRSLPNLEQAQQQQQAAGGTGSDADDESGNWDSAALIPAQNPVRQSTVNPVQEAIEGGKVSPSAP